MTEGGGSQPCKTLKLLAACGVIAPVLLTALWIVAGLIRPGYNHLTQYGSELGVGSNSILMNANFVLFGLLITPLALGLHKGINQGRGSRIGPALIVVVGATFIGSGVFPASGGFLRRYAPSHGCDWRLCNHSCHSCNIAKAEPG